MPATDKAQINFTLSHEKKEKWEKHLEDSPEHTSMAQFIRFAVQKQIIESNRDSEPTDASGIAGETAIEINDRTKQIKSRLEQLSEQVERVEQSLDNPPEEVIELSGDVLEVLPTEVELSQTQHSAMPAEDVPVVVDGIVQTGRPEDIADHLSVDTYRVRMSLNQLTEDTGLVKSMPVDGEQRYYRRD